MTDMTKPIICLTETIDVRNGRSMANEDFALLQVLDKSVRSLVQRTSSTFIAQEILN